MNRDNHLRPPEAGAVGNVLRVCLFVSKITKMLWVDSREIWGTDIDQKIVYKFSLGLLFIVHLCVFCLLFLLYICMLY